ncbi:hypothetical protein [Tychonema sp. LEGE 07203]|nr:hypothetical protein [Tychonema sp. LEGE 07203]
MGIYPQERQGYGTRFWMGEPDALLSLSAQRVLPLPIATNSGID